MITTHAVVLALLLAALSFLGSGWLRRVDRVVISQELGSDTATVVPLRRKSLAVDISHFTLGLFCFVWIGGTITVAALGYSYGQVVRANLLSLIGGTVDALSPYYLALVAACTVGSLVGLARGRISREPGRPVVVHLGADFRERHGVPDGVDIKVELGGEQAKAEIQRMDPVPDWGHGAPY